MGLVTVDKGYFTVTLDFGAHAFNGEARFLAIAVDCGGGFTALSPRVALTPAPYALALPGLRTEQNAASPNLIGGYAGNLVTAGAVGAVIRGGGNSYWSNRVTDDYGVVSGGYGNGAGDNAGTTNDRGYATVGGGMANYATGAYSFAGGGTGNRATGNSATVSGGGNTASNDGATVGGGGSNTASGYYATVGGGVSNAASGNYSFAAGQRAKATHIGSFVWADAISADFNSTVDHQFAVRANGGVVFSSGSAAVTVNGHTVWHAGNDGSSSGLDADLLDGLHGSAYRDASNINAGTLGAAYYSAYADLSAEYYLDNNAWGDLLTRGQSDGRYWMLGGNLLALDGVLGTANNYALDVRVNGARALRLEPNVTSPNVIGGYSGNYVTAGAYGATIGGGGGRSGFSNRVTDSYGTIGGGDGNRVGNDTGAADDAMAAAVVGGSVNTASGVAAFVGGGWSNTASGDYAAVSGGASNLASGRSATVGGGWNGSDYAGNQAQAIASTIGGGYGNIINSAATYATIAGGNRNSASASETFVGGGIGNQATVDRAVVVGGWYNTASVNVAAVGGGAGNVASGAYSVVPGGNGNAAGRPAKLCGRPAGQGEQPGLFHLGRFDRGRHDLQHHRSNGLSLRRRLHQLHQQWPEQRDVPGCGRQRMECGQRSGAQGERHAAGYGGAAGTPGPDRDQHVELPAAGSHHPPRRADG
jgi:hypothetical protein